MAEIGNVDEVLRPETRPPMPRLTPEPGSDRRG
jgi:hypothetical protein